LWLDNCKDPHSAGMIGFRKVANPKFDATKWSADGYLADPTIEPPYLIGTACGSCHATFNPTKPPAHPVHPQWANLVFPFGNQYINEAAYFITPFKDNDFRWQSSPRKSAGRRIRRARRRTTSTTRTPSTPSSTSRIAPRTSRR